MKYLFIFPDIYYFIVFNFTTKEELLVSFCKISSLTLMLASDISGSI